ncbi:hypothetical protein [Amnibacterium kyonggiense]
MTAETPDRKIELRKAAWIDGSASVAKFANVKRPLASKNPLAIATTPGTARNSRT